MEIEINRNSKLSNKENTCWQVYTRNKLGISIMVGSIFTDSDLKYPDIIIKVKKELKREIKKINNSEYVFESKIYGGLDK